MVTTQREVVGDLIDNGRRAYSRTSFKGLHLLIQKLRDGRIGLQTVGQANEAVSFILK